MRVTVYFCENIVRENTKYIFLLNGNVLKQKLNCTNNGALQCYSMETGH